MKKMKHHVIKFQKWKESREFQSDIGTEEFLAEGSEKNYKHLLSNTKVRLSLGSEVCGCRWR